MSWDDNSVLHVPPYVQMERRGLHLLIDPATPNWMATNRRGNDACNFTCAHCLVGSSPMGEHYVL